MPATSFRTLRKHIFLHPVDKKSRHKALESELLRGKNKYSDRLEGALLDVKNIKVVGDRHLIVNGYTSMQVVADFKVFSPHNGLVLEGVVNKRSFNHIGCLVMDTFNAALTLKETDQGNLDPQIGDTCDFKVTEVVVDGEIMFMRGLMERITKKGVHVPSMEDETELAQSTNESSNNTGTTQKKSPGKSQSSTSHTAFTLENPDVSSQSPTTQAAQSVSAETPNSTKEVEGDTGSSGYRLDDDTNFPDVPVAVKREKVVTHTSDLNGSGDAANNALAERDLKKKRPGKSGKGDIVDSHSATDTNDNMNTVKNERVERLSPSNIVIKQEKVEDMYGGISLTSPKSEKKKRDREKNRSDSSLDQSLEQNPSKKPLLRFKVERDDTVSSSEETRKKKRKRKSEQEASSDDVYNSSVISSADAMDLDVETKSKQSTPKSDKKKIKKEKIM